MKRLIIIEDDKVFEVHPSDDQTIDETNTAIPDSQTYEGPWPKNTQRFKWDNATKTVVSDEDEDAKEKQEEKKSKANKDFEADKRSGVNFRGHKYEGGLRGANEIQGWIDIALEDKDTDVEVYTLDDEEIILTLKQTKELKLKILRKLKNSRKKKHTDIKEKNGKRK